MLVKGVAIQDLHFGHKATERMYNELHQVKDFLENNEVHILNINGDYFDRKLSGVEPATFYALNFFSDIIEICKRKNIKVRIILGTRSHDLNQISTMFNHYMNRSDLDLKYITKVQTEDILGMHVLYVPEEYVNDPHYYDEFKKDSFAAMHGHGTWDFVNFAAKVASENEEKENSINIAPIFMYNEWKNALKNGFSIFGHIHKRQHKGNVYYSGSFTRWGFGDRSEKGFMTYEYDTDTKKWKVDYINNKEAPDYDVISIIELFGGQKLEDISLEDINKVLTEKVASTDNLRIDLSGLGEDRIKLLRKTFEGNSKVKIQATNKKSKLLENVEEKTYEKYEYILKRQLPLEETLKRFILEEKGIDLDLDLIRDLVNND